MKKQSIILKMERKLLSINKNFQLKVASGATIHKFAYFYSLAKNRLDLAKKYLEKNEEKFDYNVAETVKWIRKLEKLMKGEK